MSNPVIVGIDIGSQSLKVVVVDSEMRVLGRGSVEYPIEYPKPGWAQQDPAHWDRAMKVAITSALAQANCSAQSVVGVGVAGQLDGCVAVNKDGDPLGPCLIWMDRRAESCMPELDSLEVLKRTGTVTDATHMAAKIRWLKRNALGLEGARFHQPVSYMVERLTGANVFDRGLASTTMLYDIEASAMSEELARSFGVSLSEVPRVADASSVAGTITAAAASATGLPEGIPVAVGTGDDFATPLGAGLIDPGAVCAVLGTAEVVGALSSKFVLDEAALLETHEYPGSLFFVENPGWLSGGAVTWARELFGFASDAEFDVAAARSEPGAGGVMFLPALSGAMTPEWNASVRGAFYGLTPGHGREHFARAVLEGCAYAMLDILDRLSELGVAMDRLFLLGGGAKSALWAQIRADASGLPVTASSVADSCAVGAAVLASTAAGQFTRVRDACRKIEISGVEYTPDETQGAVYRENHERYGKLFWAIAESSLTRGKSR